MRGSTRRAWIKVFVTGWLHGSIRWQLEPAERGVFIDLLVLAGECGREGEISDNDSRPFPLDFLANSLNITRELLDSTIDKCVKEGRLLVKEDVIIVVNWKAYQSEYDRQKQYRQKPEENTDPDKYLQGKLGHMVKR